MFPAVSQVVLDEEDEDVEVDDAGFPVVDVEDFVRPVVAATGVEIRPVVEPDRCPVVAATGTGVGVGTGTGAGFGVGVGTDDGDGAGDGEDPLDEDELAATLISEQVV